MIAGSLAEMMSRHAQAGRLDAIMLRPVRRGAVVPVAGGEVTDAGLVGDHGRKGPRAVTLLQAEHLDVIAALLGRPVAAGDLRRNIVICGINLAALRKGRIRVGAVVLQVEGPCPPCSRMEEVLGHGGYSAVRGHGGWYASAVTGGAVAVGDPVVAG